MIIIILSVFVIIILTIEFLAIVKSSKGVNKKQRSISKIEDDTIFDRYIVDADINIILKPGKIYIKDDINAFIKNKDDVILMDINKIYEIPEPFTLEILNVNKKKISYYYISN